MTRTLSILLALGSALVLAAPARADCVIATVAAGTMPYVVAVNPVTDNIYVANFNNSNSQPRRNEGATVNVMSKTHQVIAS